MVQPSLLSGIVVVVAVSGAFLAERYAFRFALAGESQRSGNSLLLALVALLACLLGLLAFGWLCLPSPRDHAYGAIVWVMLIYGMLHAFIALVILAFVRQRIASGYVSPARMLEPRVARLWLRYGLAVILIVLAAIGLPGGASWRW